MNEFKSRFVKCPSCGSTDTYYFCGSCGLHFGSKPKGIGIRLIKAIEEIYSEYPHVYVNCFDEIVRKHIPELPELKDKEKDDEE